MVVTVEVVVIVDVRVVIPVEHEEVYVVVRVQGVV